MMDLLEHWFTTLQPTHFYLVVFLLMTSNGFLSTPPSEVTLGLAGLVASLGNISLLGVLVAGVTGNVFGTTLLYLLAYRWGEGIVRKALRLNPFIGESLLAATREAFRRHGSGIILVGRCLPLVRSIISVPAGLSRMHFTPFLLLTATGCLLWAGLWAGAGWFLGTEVKVLIDETKVYALSIAILVLTLAAFWLSRQVRSYLAAGTNSRDCSR